MARAVGEGAAGDPQPATAGEKKPGTRVGEILNGCPITPDNHGELRAAPSVQYLSPATAG